MDYAQTIMSLIAVGALIVSFISVRMAKAQIAASIEIAEKQIRAQLVSANRLQWIEGLRSDVAEFITLSWLLTNTTIDTKWDERLLHAMRMISLRLNVNESEHKKLVDKMNAVVDASKELSNARHTGGKPEEKAVANMIDQVDSIAECARTIFKKEWERVKRGE